MARKSRRRSPSQKLRRKFQERLSTLKIKITELNAVTEGRATMVWTYKGETSICGDEQLLESLRYNPGVYPNRIGHPTSPSNSTSSSASHNERFQIPTEKSSFENGGFLDLDLLQERQASAASANGKGSTQKAWRKEDLDFLVNDFFSEPYVL
ncbi:hypothetical protein N656DRAFT_803031 [Canariomyces notabilis]|uniref:MADS-box domain-containing protein n=1 Tax=Canariomyces notabilis TaxID=2074819 RepID=A0AAN6QF29_9PEZI|nr:hypothetical protein N656DRAFT_803031 [Canariomyces arenarius]